MRIVNSRWLGFAVTTAEIIPSTAQRSVRERACAEGKERSVDDEFRTGSAGTEEKPFVSASWSLAVEVEKILHARLSIQ